MFNGNPISPLRYPGGKTLLSNYIADVMEAHLLIGCTFYEPYVGGASVSLDLFNKGFIANAIWLERDPLIYAFWYSVLRMNEQLCEEIYNLDVSLETWDSYQDYRRAIDPPNDLHELLLFGLAGLFFNRTNFSGILKAGPIGGRNQSSNYGIDCRFKKDRLITQIQNIARYSDRIELHYGDAISFMDNNVRRISSGFNFVYVDPPYYVQGKELYRYFYNDRQHEDLAFFIRAQNFPWLISYDDHPKIREFYSANEIQPIYLDYKVRTSRRAQELLISNIEIPPPVYEKLGIVAA
jgi:DNA adenine methylase